VAPRVVVVGLGNPLLGDDAAGLAVADELERLLAVQPVPGVTVARSYRGGLELLNLVAGFDQAVLIDALLGDDPVPGRVHELDVAGTAGSARLVGSHEVDLATALELGRRAGLAMPAAVRVIGIEAADVLSFREALSPAVAKAVREVARRLHGELAAQRSAQG
jgi:hydrogenase maturation protease